LENLQGLALVKSVVVSSSFLSSKQLFKSKNKKIYF
jgi:hypothetical protein